MKRSSVIGFVADLRYRKVSQTATVNDLLKEIFRKTIHLCASLVPFFAFRNYRWTLVILSFIIIVYTVCELLRRFGHPVPVVSCVTAYASRRRDEGGFVLGPVTLALGVLLTLLFFPPEPARIGIYALAFGDGIASLAGKIFGRIRIPLTGGKTVAGSVACFFAVFVSTVLLTRNPLLSLEVALLCVVLEAIPVKDYDNLFIPLIISAFVCSLP
jgi:dolichol kinase